MNTSVTRRGFAGYIMRGFAAIAIAGSTIGLTGCGVFNEILAYVGVGLQAFQAVVDLLAGFGVLPIGTGGALDGIIALIKAGFADLQTAVNQYEAAPASQK